MFSKLAQGNTSNTYIINKKKPFSPVSNFQESEIQKSFEFAWNMTFGDQGEHRSHRSGGQHQRRKGEVFINTFQGKLAEFTVFNYLKSNYLHPPLPDLTTFGLGIWDSIDIEVAGKKLNIKSTKHYGNLLLLETKDWASDGQYLPNKEKHGNGYYDFFVLVRLSPDGESLMKSNRLLFTDTIDHDSFQKIIFSQNWQSDIPGFVRQQDVQSIITERFILPRNSCLNVKTIMDADNYYIQAGEMLDKEELLTLLKKNA